ncbi:RHS repeat-associated core domain-containing protein [Hydromonas duriensis]|uniref:RHS repeat-associated protein n=1 Tax=Hydromonas duriensis TaxID=1527608 RepID=A0A4V3DJE8_9BURK|nr:RHS repeat-associated core domain-containing protein [Hydromonas duriensis]TDR27756.1 RHS repeat-associated protein [Hydromonas duriensis]
MTAKNKSSHVIVPLNSIAVADVVTQIKKIEAWLLSVNPNAQLKNLKGKPTPVVSNIFAATGALIDIIAIADGTLPVIKGSINPKTAQYAYLTMNLIGLTVIQPDEAHARMALRPILALAYEYLGSKEAKIPDSGIMQITRHLNDKIAGDLETFLTDAKAKLPALTSAASSLLVSLASDLSARLNSAISLPGSNILAQATAAASELIGAGSLKRDPASTYTDWIAPLASAIKEPTEVPTDAAGATLRATFPGFVKGLAQLTSVGATEITQQAGSAKGQLGWVIDELLKAVQNYRKKGESTAVPVSTVGIHNAQVVGDTLEFMSFQASAVSDPSCKNGATSDSGKRIGFATGRETINHLDFSIKGMFEVTWLRTYSSNLVSYDNDVFGARWITPYTTRIVQSSNQLVYFAADGRLHPYPSLVNGGMSHNSIEKITLTRISETMLTLTRGADWVETYEADPDYPRAYRLTMLNDVKNSKTVGIRYDYKRNGRTIISDIVTKVNGQIESHIATKPNEHGQITELWHIVNGQPERQLAHYQYDNENNLILAQDENAQYRTYEYQNHLVTRYTDRTGRGMNLMWQGSDYQARAVREWADDGTFDTQLSWDDSIRKVTVTNALGHETQYFYDVLGYTYRIIYSNGLEEWYSRDSRKNITSRTSRRGATSYSTYDIKDNLTSSIRPDGGKVYYKYNEQDKLIAVADPLGNVWEQDYNNKGNMSETIDPLGYKTEYEYNNQGLLIGVTDAKNGKKQITYTPDGNVSSLTDCSGKTSAWAYDKKGRLIKQSNAIGQTVEYKYSDEGINRGQLKTIIHADKSEEHFERDAEGRLLTYIDPKGQRTTYTYTRAGLIKQRIDADGHVFQYTWDKAGNILSLTNANGTQYSFEYNQFGQLIKETNFNGKSTEYEYNPKTGELLKVFENGIVSALAFDSMGRIVGRAVKDINSNLIQTEQFSFDLNGQLIHATNNHSTLDWYYDDAGQLIREHQQYHIQPEHGDAYHHTAIWRHEYDELGNRIKTIRPDGHSITHLTYGSGHVHGLMLDHIEAFAFERDDLHREISRTQANHLQQTLSYDPAGRLKQQLIRIAETNQGATAQPININRSYTYDTLGQLTSINDTRRGLLNYKYDPVGRLLQAHSTQFKETFAFDPAGNILEATPNTYGAPTKDDGLYSADERQQNQNARLKNMLKAYVGTHYTYDQRGNLIERLEHGKRTVFKWDNFNRMSQANTDDMKVNFYYDVLGRRIAKHSGSVFQGTSMDGSGYAASIRKQHNDAAGYGYTIYGWDGDTLAWESTIAPTKLFDDQPSHARTTHYIYAPNSFEPLMQATVNESIELLPTPNYKEMAQSTQGYDIDRDPVWHYKAEQFVRAFDSVLYYQCDHLGTPQELTDEQGEVAWAAHYMAWGRAFETMSDSAKRAGIKNPLRFQGQYYDNETGLHYNRHRYYDPHAGRYVSKDPIGLKGGWNLHSYVHNPIQWIDPLGLESVGKANPLTWGPLSYVKVGGDALNGFEYAKSVEATRRSDPNIRADQSRPRTDGGKWEDGCGDKDTDQWVPDVISLVYEPIIGKNKTYTFSILEPCKKHDACYGAASKSGASKSACDRELWNGVIKACVNEGAPVGDCSALGEAYYMGVSAGGGKAWKNAGGK